MNREEKKQAIDELKEKFGRARGVVVTDYKGMTVAEITELREALKSAGFEYKVVKNTLARIASLETPAAPIAGDFKGPVGVAMGFNDAVRVAKSVLEFAKKNEKLKVAAGLADGVRFDAVQLKRIAELPPREVLLATLAGTMQAPAAKFARLLNATVVGLAYALDALRRKKAAA